MGLETNPRHEGSLLRSINMGNAERAISLADATRPRSDQDIDARTVPAALTTEKLND